MLVGQHGDDLLADEPVEVEAAALDERNARSMTSSRSISASSSLDCSRTVISTAGWLR